MGEWGCECGGWFGWRVKGIGFLGWREGGWGYCVGVGEGEDVGIVIGVEGNVGELYLIDRGRGLGLEVMDGEEGVEGRW